MGGVTMPDEALITYEIYTTLAQTFEDLLKRFGDTPENRLAIARYTIGYMGVAYGIHIPR